MRHHLLPQCYLEGFTDPVCEPGRTPHVWVCTAQTGTWKRRGPKNVAAMTDYYALPDGKGGTDLVLEKALSFSERGFARAMREVVIPRKALDDDARGALAVFAALMFVRLPAQHKQMNDFQVERAKMMMEMMRGVYGKDEETWQAYLKRMEEQTGQSLSGLRPEHFDPDKFEITIPHERTLALAFAKVEKLANVIMNMGWRLYYASDPDSFITSDQPLALYSRALEGQSFYRPGLMWPDDVELTLPLSRSVALFGSWSEDGVIQGDATTKEVLAFNIRSATYTRDLFVASVLEFPGREDIQREIDRERATGKKESSERHDVAE